jgi:hypothetical protein
MGDLSTLSLCSLGRDDMDRGGKAAGLSFLALAQTDIKFVNKEIHYQPPAVKKTYSLDGVTLNFKIKPLVRYAVT